MIKIDDNFYIHPHGYFHSQSPRDSFCDPGIMKELINFFSDNSGSVLDLGCGDGRYIKGLMEIGVDVMGYDGNPYVESITGGLCKVWDLTEVRELDDKFDWVLCLEVGEHIPEEFQNSLIQNIHLNNKKGILISWAVEGQGGSGHVNCRNNDYIENLFASLGYTLDKESSQKFRDSATNCYWFKNTFFVFRRMVR